MAETTRALIDQQADIARATDAAVGAFERELADVVRKLERQIRSLAADVADESRTAILKAARLSRLRNELRNALTDAGFDALLDHATDTALDRIARAALSYTVGQDVSAFVGPLQSRIDALKALTLSDLLGQGDEVTRQLWRATVRGVFSARSVDQIIGDLAQVIDDTIPHLRTLYDTSVSVYGRQVEMLQAGDDTSRLYIYLGPIDAVVRPFCRAWVGKVLSRAEIDQLDNGQLPNVMLTGGGYNCRHAWKRIAKTSDLRTLHGTDQRAPEMDEALQRVDAQAARGGKAA